jgi:hypothetical protein
MSTPPRLPPEFLAMVAKGVSAIVGSRDAQLRPSLMRAVGSKVEDEGRVVTVYLSRPQSRQVLQDIAATGHVTVVFSQPSTHRTVQLKARRATLRDATEADVPVLTAYCRAMAEELTGAGYPGDKLAPMMLAHKLDEVVAVTFTPEQASDQTPGPRAGTPLGAA